MATQAEIRSVDDIVHFRAHLLTFLSGARAAVEEIGSEGARQQSWLDLDRRKHWEAEVWRRQRALEEARQRLFQESLSNQRGPPSFYQMQVHRAERAFEDAREKANRTRSWSRNFENQSLPMLKQVEQLHAVLTVDMARAVHFLNQTISSLEAYASRPATVDRARATAEAEAGAQAGFVKSISAGQNRDDPASGAAAGDEERARPVALEVTDPVPIPAAASQGGREGGEIPQERDGENRFISSGARPDAHTPPSPRS